MAKKKATAKALTDKEIKKRFGEVSSTGTELIGKRQKMKRLGISPMLDMALSGGVQEGSWLVTSGPPKTGKTSSMLHFLKQAYQGVICLELLYPSSHTYLSQYRCTLQAR